MEGLICPTALVMLRVPLCFSFWRFLGGWKRGSSEEGLRCVAVQRQLWTQEFRSRSADAMGKGVTEKG